MILKENDHCHKFQTHAPKLPSETNYWINENIFKEYRLLEHLMK